ncbi:MAG: PAS domain-containing protein [Xanthomonadales bacterium]|nr:PAS domain-containing protein [Xanthomonadales bacterium]
MACILVVDEDDAALADVVGLFEAQGHRVLIAATAAQAQAVALQQAPDLVLVQLRRNALEGYALLCHWRSQPDLCGQRFVLHVVADPGRDDARLAVELGANAFLAWPCAAPILLARVATVLAAPTVLQVLPEQVPEQVQRVLLQRLTACAAELERSRRELRNDLDARRRAEHALRVGEARLRAVIDSEPECVMQVSLDGALLDINPAGLRMIENEDLAAVRGYPVLELVHPGDRVAFVDLHLRASTGATGVLEFRLLGLRGGERWVESHSTPLRAEDGSVQAVLSITRDISASRAAAARLRAQADEQQRLLRALERERSRLLVAQQIAKVGSWESSPDSDEVYWTEQMHRIFETHPARFKPNLQSTLECVHPDDRERIESTYKDSIRRPGGGPRRVEHRLRMADGRIKHVEQCWEVVCGPDGRATLAFGTSRDISEQHAAQVAFARLQRAATALFDAFWEWSADSDELSFSASDPVFAATAPQTQSQRLARIHADDRARVAAALERAMGAGAPSWNGHYRWCAGAAGEIAVHERVAVLRDTQGCVQRVVGGLCRVDALSADAPTATPAPAAGA